MAYTEVVTTLGALASAYATAAGASNTTTFSITNAGRTADTFTFANGVGIRSIASRTGFVRVYDPTLGGTKSAATANLPQLTGPGSVLAHTAYDDAAPWYAVGSPSNLAGELTTPPTTVSQQGMIEVFPKVPAVDVVNAASVPTFKSDALTQIVLTHD
jgi:hypothetical protein